MKTKKCSICKLEKPVDQFYPHATRGLQAYCKPCNKASRHQHYLENKAAYRAQAIAFRAELVAEVSKMKSDSPCADCGQYFPPCAMDFDHVRGVKHKCVGQLSAGACRKKVMAEIEKCDLVCACCHRIRTHRRRQKAREGAIEPS